MRGKMAGRAMALGQRLCHISTVDKYEASMRSKQALTIILLSAIGLLAGCSRDPNVVKKRYLDSGNRYFEKGKYKEARIMYLDALQKDQRYGPAYYKLGL